MQACINPDPYLWPHFLLPNYKTTSYSLPKEGAVLGALVSVVSFAWQSNKSYFFLFHPKLCLHISIQQGWTEAESLGNTINSGTNTILSPYYLPDLQLLFPHLLFPLFLAAFQFFSHHGFPVLWFSCPSFT